MVRDLNLTEDQQQRIQATVRDSRSHLIQLRADVEKAEAELSDLMNDEPVDTRRAGEAIEKVISTRGEMLRAVSQMSVKLRQVLTLNQWRELQRRRPRPMGPPMGDPSRPGRGFRREPPAPQPPAPPPAAPQPL